MHAGQSSQCFSSRMGSFIFLYGRALCHGEGEAFQCAVGGRGWQGFIAWLREGGSSAGGRCWWDDEICNFFRAKWEGFSEHSGGMWGGAPSARGCCRWDGGICSVLGGGVPNVVGWCQWDDALGDSGDTNHMGKENENELPKGIDQLVSWTIGSNDLILVWLLFGPIGSDQTGTLIDLRSNRSHRPIWSSFKNHGYLPSKFKFSSCIFTF